MAFDDQLRDRVSVQVRVVTTDSGFGQSDSWIGLLSVPARIAGLNGREIAVYQREGYANVLRVACDNAIRWTSGFDCLDELLLSSGLEAMRLEVRGRKLKILGIVHPVEGMNDSGTDMLYLDCVEYPMIVGDVGQ